MNRIFSCLSAICILSASMLVGCAHQSACSRGACSTGSCGNGSCQSSHTSTTSQPQNYMEAFEQQSGQPAYGGQYDAYSGNSEASTYSQPMHTPTSPQGSGYRSSMPAPQSYGGSGSR